MSDLIITKSAPDWAWAVIEEMLHKKIENPKIPVAKRQRYAMALASFVETQRKIEQKPLILEDLVIGKEYRFAKHPGVRECLWGKRCLVEKKKIKRVQTVLLEDTIIWKAGTKLTGPAHHLEEIL